MVLVRNKAFGFLFWLVAFVAVVAGAVAGGKIGNGGAPEFGDGSGASASSHLIFAIGGAFFCGGGVLAIFAGAWMAMWALDRRAHPRLVDVTNGSSLDDFDFDAMDFDVAEADHDRLEAFIASRR